MIDVYLFGRFSEIEANRYPSTKKLVEAVNAKKVTAIVSLYSVQEIFCFCKDIFSLDAGHVSRISLALLFNKVVINETS